MKQNHLSLSLVALFGLTGPAFAGSVRGGGDTLRLTFVQAQETAARYITKMNEGALPSNMDGEVRKFILGNKNKLAADVLASDHEWIYEENTGFTACAQTDIPGLDEANLPHAAKISLYFPVCRIAAPSVKDAAALLIHESVHHFGNPDHDFADRVALAIVKAWESGLTDWEAMPNGPEARDGASSVWTGQEFLMFGGAKAGSESGSSDFYAYNPDKKSWRRIDAPANLARTKHLAVWTNDEMIIWGGEVCVPITGTSSCNVQWLNSGAAYNLEKNTWRTIAAPRGPDHLIQPMLAYSHRAQDIAWTGDRLALWGGDCALSNQNSGGLWNPESNTWESLPNDTSALRCSGHTLTYGDNKLYVYGGFAASSTDPHDPQIYVSSAGSVYDLKNRSWSTITPPSGTKPRYAHTAVWSGKELIIFSGILANADLRALRSSGLLYRPTSGWKAFATEAVPERDSHFAAWTGNEMVVYGGKTRYLSNLLGDVSFFDPNMMTWRVTSTSSDAALDPRMNASVAWTGNKLVVFGGLVSPTSASGTAVRNADGAVFRP